MDRTKIINTIGIDFHSSNIEDGEYSYVAAAGSLKKLEKLLGRKPIHYKLDIRFHSEGTSVLVETKQKFTKEDENQLAEYVEEERVLHPNNKIIAILANTTSNDDIMVWKDEISDSCILKDETVLENMSHYIKIFKVAKNNNKALVMQNTYKLNEMLHKYNIDERIRSQFVGTCLLYVKNIIKSLSLPSNYIDSTVVSKINEKIKGLSTSQIISNIKGELEKLLVDKDTYKKLKKVEILHDKVLGEQCIKDLTFDEFKSIIDTITIDIYIYGLLVNKRNKRKNLTFYIL